MELLGKTNNARLLGECEEVDVGADSPFYVEGRFNVRIEQHALLCYNCEGVENNARSC